MIDYGQNEKFHYRIESRVDEPMSIVGIKVFNFLNIAFIGIFSLFVSNSLLVTLGVVSLAVTWFRKSNKAERDCKPLMFHGRFIAFTQKLPEFFRVGLFPSVFGTDSYDKYYRQ